MQQNKFASLANLLDRKFNIGSFDKYFLHSKENMSELNSIIKNCKVDDLNCRFNIWRLCLRLCSNDATIQEKKEQIEHQRNQYLRKKTETVQGFVDKKSPQKEKKKNPLMMMGTKQENKKQESDDFLKEEILKDVERTYQEMEFFQHKEVAKLLNTILFVWCKLNPDVSYKQGMNELLASVVVCYFQEVEFKTLADRPEGVSEELWQNHIFFNGAQFAEADVFGLFSKIVNIQCQMYKTEADQEIKTKVNPNSKNNTPILQRIMQIKDHKLKHMDLDLFRIIKLQDVQTKSFMLRWIRCMHTRQFSLENSFVIWDSIFLEYWESPNSKVKGQFEFIDAMCIAMFIYMRSIVLSKQTAGEILHVYQKYPPLKRGEYLDELISLAWNVCEEMRLQQGNSGAVSNWFQESGQAKHESGLVKKPSPPKKIQEKFEDSPAKTEMAETVTPKNAPFMDKPSSSQAPKPKKQSKKSQSYETNNEQKQEEQKSTKHQEAKVVEEQKIYKVSFSSVQIKQMVSELQSSLPEIKDIDVKANIRKILNKLQGKLNKK